MDGYLDPRGRWTQTPADAFTDRGERATIDYPADRARVDDARPAAGPRYTYPESATGSVGPAATTAPFLVFSGVPDLVLLDPGTAEATFTFRDDAGRSIGTANASVGGIGPLAIRCKRVDVTVPGGAATVVSVTGYYKPAARDYPEHRDDLSAEASAVTAGPDA